MKSLIAVAVALAACGEQTSSTTVDAMTLEPDAADASVDSPPSTATDPATPGPSSVTTMTVSIPGAASGRTLPSTVYIPQDAGPHALAIISPGFFQARTQYATYAQHLASWGFVVLLTDYAESGFSIDHQRVANDVPAVITWALAQSSLAVDPQRIAALGHSLGGKISFLAASAEPRIKAIVAWDPVDSNTPSVTPELMDDIDIAIAVIGETTNSSGGFMPCAPAADNYTQYYMAAASPALQATIAGADHMDWVDDQSCSTCGLCPNGTVTPDAVHTATRRLNVAWLRKQLFADATMDQWLTAATGVAVVSK